MVEKIDGWWVVPLTFLVGVMCGFSLGVGFGDHSKRTEAIEAGVARYTVDPKTGETNFEWVKPDR